MTRRKSPAPRGPVLTAATIAALLLTGCSSGHVGDSWQCPLATGGACDSVAAADPAVPDAGVARQTLLTEPLWRVRDSEPAPPTEPACESACGGGFDPFGWLARLFGGEEDRAPEKPNSPSATDTVRPPETRQEPAEPAAATLPAEHAGGDDLRSGEAVARIWIAPFVDADGVYREASHVRVVLEPAGWRLPR